MPGIGGWVGGGEEVVERRPEVVEPLPGLGRDPHDPGARERGLGQALPDLLLGEVERVRVDEVALRQRDDAAGDPEHVEDREVFLGLRPPALVRGDDEQDQTDRAHAGEHVRDEALVPRDVDEADLPTGRELAPRVAEVDREPRRFSSSQRSGSIPVRRTISEDFPWST